MKKVFLILLLVICIVGPVFCTDWTKSDLLDDFGDKNGHFALESNSLPGSYKNEFGQSGELYWSIVISDEGNVFLDIHEDINKNLSITSKGPTEVSTNEELDVKIKVEDSVFQFYGTIQKDENYVYDRIALYEVSTTYGEHYNTKENTLFSSIRINYNLKAFFLNNSQMKIIVSGSKGQYSLGLLDTTNLESSWFYDTSLVEKGISLVSENKYKEAEEIFEQIKENDNETYDFYELDDYIHTCREKRIAIEIEKMSGFIDTGDYSNALKAAKAIKELDQLYNEYTNDMEIIEHWLKEAAKEYNIGERGPAYGLIFYDCDADNDEGNPDGLISTECGWRYLEAAPSVIFISNNNPMVTTDFFYSGDIQTFPFGENKNEFGENAFVNNTRKYSNSNCTKTGIGTGKKNTSLLIATMENKNQTAYAAKLCADLEYMITIYNRVFDDWFLPSRDELKLLLTNLDCNVANNNLPYGRYWSSSEDPTDPDLIWTVECPYQWYYYGDDPWGFDRYNSFFIRPIRSF